MALIDSNGEILLAVISTTKIRQAEIRRIFISYDGTALWVGAQQLLAVVPRGSLVDLGHGRTTSAQ